MILATQSVSAVLSLSPSTAHVYLQEQFFFLDYLGVGIRLLDFPRRASCPLAAFLRGTKLTTIMPRFGPLHLDLRTCLVPCHAYSVSPTPHETTLRPIPQSSFHHAATTYGTSTFQLAMVNEASIDENCDNLEIGGTVCLGIDGQDCTKVYTVKTGE